MKGQTEERIEAMDADIKELRQDVDNRFKSLTDNVDRLCVQMSTQTTAISDLAKSVGDSVISEKVRQEREKHTEEAIQRLHERVDKGDEERRTLKSQWDTLQGKRSVEQSKAYVIGSVAIAALSLLALAAAFIKFTS